jgi:hypothetical protein
VDLIRYDAAAAARSESAARVKTAAQLGRRGDHLCRA